MKNIALIILAFLGFTELSFAAKSKVIESSTFTINTPTGKKSFRKNDLLKLEGVKSITVEKDPAYPGLKTTYTAVPVAQIFKEVDLSKATTINFKCLDGFSGNIDKNRILNTSASRSIAYIAIEDHPKWPALKKGKPQTAGPFYLIWEDPDKSKIMTEEWPYQLSGFEVSNDSLQTQYPNTYPVNANSDVQVGYTKFMTNCFVCHSMNGDGGVKIGPDLNIPFSPSEYLKADYFKILVRNPQALRKWPQARMSSFDKTQLSDEDLQKIWSYFTFMSEHKVKQ